MEVASSFGGKCTVACEFVWSLFLVCQILLYFHDDLTIDILSIFLLLLSGPFWWIFMKRITNDGFSRCLRIFEWRLYLQSAGCRAPFVQ